MLDLLGLCKSSQTRLCQRKSDCRQKEEATGKIKRTIEKARATRD